jgi:Gluconate 2-dehydrogenase subunit 3
MSTMTRRDAIRRAAMIVGGSIAFPDLLRAWEYPAIENPHFRMSAAMDELLAEVAETIVPTTDTPGAKAAGVVPVIKKIVADCLESADQNRFFTGLESIDGKASGLLKKGFTACSAAERLQVLQAVEQDYTADKTAHAYWMQIKGLVVSTYFTSEIGCTQALRYEPVPGRYDGSAPYKKGEKAWAT